MTNEIWVEVTITVNGEEWHYVAAARRYEWETFPEYRLGLLKMLKARLVDKATAGLEPKVTLYDSPPPMGETLEGRGPTEDLWIGATK